jgi:hypothetical protein
MARTEIVVQDQLPFQVIKGTDVAVDATNGMFVKNNGFVKLVCRTTASGAGTMTIKSRKDTNRRLGDIVVTFGASEVWDSSFFPVQIFNEGGSLELDFTGIVGVTISAIRQVV